MGKIKSKMLDVVSTKKFGFGFATIVGGVVAACLYKIGESIGCIDGMEQANACWVESIDKAIKESKEKEDENSKSED